MNLDRDEVKQMLGAYADGELEPAQAAAVEAFLREDDALGDELERIRSLKRQLAALRPPIASDEAARQPEKRNKAPVAAAAAVALIALAGVVMLMTWQTRPPTAAAIIANLHDRLSRAAYVIDERYEPRLVSGGPTLEFTAPDLTPSNLFLVDVATSASAEFGAFGVHYRGRRGCRLTIVAIQDIVEVETSDNDRLMRFWAHQGASFAVVADGMDPQRFHSIADFVESTIEQDRRRRANLRIAMAEQYREARPCA